MMSNFCKHRGYTSFKMLTYENSSYKDDECWPTGLAKKRDDIFEKNLSESNSVDETTEFSGFIIIESLEETCFAGFSSFFSSVNLQTVKNIRCSNQLNDVENGNHDENLL